MFNTAAVNTVMGLMSHLTDSDLRDILNDDSKFEQFANELKPVRNSMIKNYNCHYYLYTCI